MTASNPRLTDWQVALTLIYSKEQLFEKKDIAFVMGRPTAEISFCLEKPITNSVQSKINYLKENKLIDFSFFNKKVKIEKEDRPKLGPVEKKLGGWRIDEYLAREIVSLKEQNPNISLEKIRLKTKTNVSKSAIWFFLDRWKKRNIIEAKGVNHG